MTKDQAETPSASERLRERGWDVLDPAVLDAEPTDMELTSVAQMRALNDPLRMRLLSAIARRPDSAKDLAERFDVPTTRLYHHLGLLEEHGFIEVVATRRSGARTERCYGMRPRSAVRPGPALTGADDRTELAAALAAVVELTGTTLAEGVIAGRIGLRDSEEEAVVVSSATLRLTKAQQHQFTEELTALQRRMVDASRETADARDRGEDPDDETVQLLIVMSPDVLAPD